MKIALLTLFRLHMKCPRLVVFRQTLQRIVPVSCCAIQGNMVFVSTNAGSRVKTALIPEAFI